MNDQETKRQLMIVGTNLLELARRVNARLDSGYWRVVPGSIGCGHTSRTIDASPTNLKKEVVEQHFWAVVEQV